MTERTAREPNYFGDIDAYGSSGEALFAEMFKTRTIYNVTKNRDFQRADIDFIVAKKGALLTEQDANDFQSVMRRDDVVKVEVKVDTAALRTGNLAYEVISHGSSGWSIVTKCDILCVVLADDYTDCLVAKNMLFIDMNRWHQFCADRRTRKHPNLIRSENIQDLLCRIDDLRDYGAIVCDYDINKVIDKPRRTNDE